MSNKTDMNACFIIPRALPFGSDRAVRYGRLAAVTGLSVTRLSVRVTGMSGEIA